MIKVWCETCKGKGVQTLAVAKPNLKGIEYIHSSECKTCNGKGYTEHEGSLEDLELAAAVKSAVSSGIRIIFAECNPENWLVKNEKTNVTIKLLAWHREQKGGNL